MRLYCKACDDELDEEEKDSGYCFRHQNEDLADTDDGTPLAVDEFMSRVRGRDRRW